MLFLQSVRLKILLLWLLPLSSGGLCIAQISSPYQFKFVNYTTKEGLVHNNAIKCLSDSKGFLWIITENGLSRFDGFQFRNFQHEKSNAYALPNNFLLDIAIDKKDRIWLTYKNGLCFLDQDTGRFYDIRTVKKFNYIKNIAYDAAKNCLWMLCQEGLFKIDADTFKSSETALSKPFGFNANSITLGASGKLWIAIQRFGYHAYDTNSNTFRSYETGCWPMKIYEDSGKDTWIATWGSGLQQFDGKSGTNKYTIYEPGDFKDNHKFGEGFIYSGVTECEKLTGKSTLWVSLLTNGIALFDKKTRKFVTIFTYQPQTKSGIPTDFNNNIYTSPEGTLWICSMRGLVKVNRQNQQFQNAELPELNSDNYNAVSGIQDDPDDANFYWMGVNGTGIAKYDKRTDSIVKKIYFRNYDPSGEFFYNKRWVDNLFTDKNHVIWAPSYGGFTKIAHGKVSFVELSDATEKKYVTSNSSYQSDDDWIWVSGFGFGYIDPYTEKKEIFRFANPAEAGKPRYFYGLVTEKNTVYAVSRYGMFSYNLDEKKLLPVNYWENLPNPELLKIGFSIERIGQVLYIGTSGGLVQYDLESKRSALIGKDRINTLNIHSLKKDRQGKLWIYNTQGLFLYNPETKSLKRFTENDGVYITSNDPAFFFEYHDQMYLGYRMSYTRFNTSIADSNKTLAIPYLTEISGNGNKPVFFKLDKNPSFRWDENNFRFRFTAIEYASPERITFRYQLQGYDQKWIADNGNRIATYTNLPAGDYTFKVEATNSNGLTNPKYALYSFAIVPAFWHTWWFRTLICCLLAFVLYIGFRMRIRSIRKKEQAKTEHNKIIAELEMKTLRSRMNPHFIFNSLNSIQKFIWENKKDDASDYLSKFAKLMRMILDFSAQSSITVKEEIEALMLYVELEKRRCNENFDFHLHIDDSINPLSEKILPLLLQPFVENAIWHGLATLENKKGLLTVSLTKKNNTLVCTVTDNGIGREKAARLKSNSLASHKSHGLEITTQRLRQLAGKSGFDAIVIADLMENGHDAGTKVTLTIPEITENHA